MDGIEHELLSPFQCYECKSLSMQVRPIRKDFTETQTGGLLIQCAECGDIVSTVEITEETYDMLLEAEREDIEYDLEEELKKRN